MLPTRKASTRSASLRAEVALNLVDGETGLSVVDLLEPV
jgi:hypothetical protein